MWRSEQNRVRRCALQTTSNRPCVDGLSNDFGRAFAELLACFRELGRITRPINQLRPEPLLQRTYAPGECRLRHIA